MATTNKIDKVVAYYLIMSQMCSDAGKGSELEKYAWKMSSNDIKKALHFRYGRKEYYIEKAIHRILRLKRASGVTFFIDTDIYEGDMKYDIVYFNMKINDTRYQISFHVPWGVKRDLKKLAGTHQTRWDRWVGGSSYTCQLLMNEVLD